MQSKCPIEYSYNFDHKINVTWQSETGQIVTTECLNINNTLIKRHCSNGKWIPAITPQCPKRQKKFVPKCDKEDEEEGDFCIHYIPPNPKKTFPFNTSIESINDTLRIAKLFKNISEMWLPVLRREKYEKFVWLEPYAKEKNKVYEHPLLIASNKEINICNYECMAATNITIIKKSENEYNVEYIPKIVNCSIYLPTVYVYKKVNRYFVSNNKTEKYGSPLYYSTIGNKAFYIHNKCQKIAEPVHKEDNILIKHLVKNKTCGIGIKYAENAKNFVWESTNIVIDYTDWVPSTQFDFDKVVISENGWSLNNSNSIQCYVCEIDRSLYATDLILTNDENNLILTAYSYDMLFISIVCQADGLDDFQYEFNFKNVNVYNKISNEITTLNQRTVWKLLVNYKKSNKVEPNYFYCSGSLFPNGDHDSTTKKVFFGRNFYSEFAFEVTFRNHCMHHICDPYLNKNFTQTLPEISTKKQIIKNIRAMRILNIDETNGDIQLLYHAQIDKIVNINSAYEQLYKELIKINNDSSISINYESLKSCQGCLPNTTLVNNISLHWNFTEIGATGYNLNCIQENYLPITRMCSGNFWSGGTWMDVLGSCNNKTPELKNTKRLRNLQSKIKTLAITNISIALANLTRESSSWTPLDVIIISDIFKEMESNLTKTKNDTIVAKSVSEAISNLVATNQTSLKLLSTTLNTTNEILTSIESVMENIAQRNLDDRGVFQQVEPNFMYQLFDPFANNIAGIALIRPNTTDKNPSFTEYKTELLTADSNISQLIEIENLEAASYVPRILIDKIKSESKNTSVKISMMFYYNDSLFVESNTSTAKKLTKIFSISIPGYKNKTLYSSVPVIFRDFYPEQTIKLNCVFWGFEDNGGIWNDDVPSKEKYYFDKQIQVCKFNHLTNFALLFGLRNYENSESGESSQISENALIYLTAIGCILSIFGIFVIFITAIVFKHWRKLDGTKIILNVSFCILMQILFLYGNMKISPTIACIITGTLLHYSVLSGFMWSLIMAYLLYCRFVKVLENQTAPNLFLKAFFVGWIVPMIPVAIIHIVLNSTEAYMPNKMHDYSNYICYPDGNLLYISVYLPVGIVVLINIVIFCMILYKVHTNTKAMSKFRFDYKQREMFIIEVKLGIYLFFSLSLPWIFGFLTATQYCDYCVYIFVLTGSSQGFILFVYYVLFNKDILHLWIKLVRFDRRIFNSSAVTVTASRTNLTDQESEMDNIKQKTLENPKKKLHKLSNTEDKTEVLLFVVTFKHS